MNSDLEIGSKKGKGFPPKNHQFKRGFSGNPHGRPKGGISFRKQVALLSDVNAKIVINDKAFGIGNKTQQLMKAINRMNQGDFAGMQRLFPHLDIKTKENA